MERPLPSLWGFRIVWLFRGFAIIHFFFFPFMVIAGGVRVTLGLQME